MTTDEQLKQAFAALRNGARQAQLRWVTAGKIDDKTKTMEATGVMDGLKYFDVQLGAGAMILYPTEGTTCLVGMVEGQDTNAFLLSATEVTKIEMMASTEIVFNRREEEMTGMVIVDKLIGQLNLIENDIGNLKSAFASWVVAPNDGGAALKSALAGYSGKKMELTKQDKIENPKVKQ